LTSKGLTGIVSFYCGYNQSIMTRVMMEYDEVSGIYFIKNIKEFKERKDEI